ncbi:MAG TPA: agmatinase family protein [Alloacidobacterium sp.]|nr:agmatinase family protein [Alloacidobacterium sp.]
MTQLHEDKHWPRAHAWLAGDYAHSATGLLRVLGVPLTLGSITPSRCDLAPKAIRDALIRFSTYDVVHGRDVRELKVEDRGDLPLAQSTVEDAQEPIVQAVRDAVRSADAVVLLGGDNSITRPALRGMSDDLKKCGLLTIDAHLDLRTLEGGLRNGNPVRALLADGLPGENIVQVGIQSFANSAAYFRVAEDAGITVIPVEQVAERGMETVVERVLRELSHKVDAIYVDLDLDVMDRAFAPATAGARPGGLTPLDIRRAAYLFGAHSKVRVMDLVEIDPTRDSNDITALAAAACLLSFASGLLERVHD